MIPDWNLSGLLPPIRPGEQGHAPDRAPYIASMSEIVNRFGTSAERKSILNGLLNYRMELYNLNIIDGFQWLDGSFMEDVESLKNRPPNDIDVVTFFKLPDGMNQQELFDSSIVISDNEYSKNTFLVDGYFMPLADSLEDWHVQQISYWYSMWSHTREQNWKGFIRVDLAPEQDVAAREIVEHMQRAEAGL